MAFCTIANKITYRDEPVKKLEDVTDKQPQYVQLQFDFMKDFKNNESTNSL